MIKAAYRVFTPSPVDLELNRDFNGDEYEYEDEAKLVIFPDHFEIPLPNIEELPALVSELLLHGSLCLFCPCTLMGGCTQWFLWQHAGWSVLPRCCRVIFRVQSVSHCHVFWIFNQGTPSAFDQGTTGCIHILVMHRFVDFRA